MVVALARPKRRKRRAGGGMAVGRVTRIVWLVAQSSHHHTSVDPSRNSVGYGYLHSGGEDLYFSYNVLQGCAFEEIQPGQLVRFVRDPHYPLATRVEPVGKLIARPSPKVRIAG